MIIHIRKIPSAILHTKMTSHFIFLALNKVLLAIYFLLAANFQEDGLVVAFAPALECRLVKICTKSKPNPLSTSMVRTVNVCSILLKYDKISFVSQITSLSQHITYKISE